jgi:hypothetical protein
VCIVYAVPAKVMTRGTTSCTTGMLASLLLYTRNTATSTSIATSNSSSQPSASKVATSNGFWASSAGGMLP